jgi:L-seryl-tRNA(Ser) seleniumtransferase
VLREVGDEPHAPELRGHIGERTAALMKVHASNYEIRGFTAAVAAAQLVKIARARRAGDRGPGSGVLANLQDSACRTGDAAPGDRRRGLS